MECSVPGHSSPNVVATSKYGPIIVNCFDKFIGTSILRHGVWDEDNIQILETLARIKLTEKSTVRIYDVGANIGTHALALAKRLGAATAIRAFEAQPMLYNMLCGTLALNGVSNVSSHLNVVSDMSGERIHIQLPDYCQGNNFGGLEVVLPAFSDNQDMIRSGETVVVNSITLDSFEEDVDVVKMDIEGMEAKALRGAVRTIERSRPLFLVEIVKSISAELDGFFLARDYRIYRGREDAIFSPRELQLPTDIISQLK